VGFSGLVEVSLHHSCVCLPYPGVLFIYLFNYLLFKVLFK